MSIIYCEKHDLKWDSDHFKMCPVCENEPVFPNDAYADPVSGPMPATASSVPIKNRPSKEEFERACSLLPLEVMWGDEITVNIVLDIASGAISSSPMSERERNLVEAARFALGHYVEGPLFLKMALDAYKDVT